MVLLEQVGLWGYLFNLPPRLPFPSADRLHRISDCGNRGWWLYRTELVTNPTLVFCDEPTSGLDAFNAQNVMNSLLTLAHAGRTVIVTLHQVDPCRAVLPFLVGNTQQINGCACSCAAPQRDLRHDGPGMRSMVFCTHTHTHDTAAP
jgi:ABC-type transport system involved in cytochrome bd biosynthesis fused ATPase/permease subunit